MLRNLVPALGALALCSAAPAQEIAKGLYMDGWVDTIFNVVNQPNYIPTNAAFSQQDASTDFYAKASIKVGWNVTDRVKTKVNVWFNNGDSAFAGATSAGDNVYMREAYVAVDAGSGISVTGGKFINHLGWTAAEPTGLFRVNSGIIAAGFYGNNDPIGAKLDWANAGGDFAATALVTNGFYRAKDGNNTASVDNGSIQAKNDLGLGLDLTYNFLKDKASNLNFEVAWDQHSSTPLTGVNPIYGYQYWTSKPGYVYQYGLNTTIRPGGKDGALMLGGEVIYKVSQNEDRDRYSSTRHNREDLAWGVLANYALETATPMSVTAAFNQVNPYFNGQAGSAGYATFVGNDPNSLNKTEYWTYNAAVVNEIALALLTNPFKDSNFGLNFEVSHLLVEGHNVTPNAPNIGGQPTHDPRDNQTTFSIEAIAVIP
jgi:hypothetical protein